MGQLLSFTTVAALSIACGKSGAAGQSFRQMHEAAQAQTDKGMSTDAAARPFVGKSVDMDVVAGETQRGICSMCFQLKFEDIQFLAAPTRDLDPLKFGIFVEKNEGKTIHIKGVIAGGAAGFAKQSPLLVEVTAYGQ